MQLMVASLLVMVASVKFDKNEVVSGAVMRRRPEEMNRFTIWTIVD